VGFTKYRTKIIGNLGGKGGEERIEGGVMG